MCHLRDPGLFHLHNTLSKHGRAAFTYNRATTVFKAVFAGSSPAAHMTFSQGSRREAEQTATLRARPFQALASAAALRLSWAWRSLCHRKKPGGRKWKLHNFGAA